MINKPIKYLGIAITSAGAVLTGLFFLGKRRKKRKELENEDKDPDKKIENENNSNKND